MSKISKLHLRAMGRIFYVLFEGTRTSQQSWRVYGAESAETSIVREMKEKKANAPDRGSYKYVVSRSDGVLPRSRAREQQEASAWFGTHTFAEASPIAEP